MKLVRRNTTLFKYYPFKGQESDVDENGFHTGVPVPVYEEPIVKRGTISAPSGGVTQALDGLEGTYTHTLIMDTPKSGIKENGLIVWHGQQFAVTAVRPSINFTLIALRRKAEDNGGIIIVANDAAGGGDGE